MPVQSPYVVCFTLTITTPASGPFQLYPILAGGSAPSGTSLGAALSYTPTGKVASQVIIQNDPTSTAGCYVYIGDSTLSATNKGNSLAVGQSVSFLPGRGSNAWLNGIYINSTSAASVLVNITVLYG